MNKPNDFDNVKAGGDFTPVELGGHFGVIKQLKETTSSSGKPMVVVCLDFDSNDKQAGYMTESFKADVRPDKKWPYNGTRWIVTEDKDGKCSKSFKSFITAFEKSNNTTVQWGDKFEAQFKNKKIGVVYGEVEEEYDGKIQVRHQIRWFCSIDKVSTTPIPERQTLDKPSTPNGGSGSSDFMSIPDGAEEELPF